MNCIRRLRLVYDVKRSDSEDQLYMNLGSSSLKLLKRKMLMNSWIPHYLIWIRNSENRR
jgi:hypothetical protein